MIRCRHILVVFVALLALSAAPVAAQNASAVASAHTTFGTGGDEQSPTTLQNMTVVGGGDATSVQFNSLFEGFEDGDISDYAGDTGSTDVVSSPVASGNYALNISSSSTNVAITDTDQQFSQGETLSYRTRIGKGSGKILIGVQEEGGWENFGGGYGITINPTSISVWKYTPYQSKIDDKTGLDIPQDEYVDVEIDWQTDGTIVISVSDNGSEIASFSVQDSSFSSGGLGFSIYDGTAQFDDVQAGGDSGTYVGAPHNASDVAQGWANLTLAEASATVTWQAEIDGSWTNVSSETIASTANVSQDLSGTTTDRWRVRVDVEATGSSPVAEIHDEGVLFVSSNPALSNPLPSGETDPYDGNISIQASDPDFSLTQGDSVVIEATNASGDTIGSQTVSSSGTVSFQYSASSGENQVTWTATDSYGNRESISQSFTTPATLEIRNESDPSQLITDANITVRFYFRTANPQVITRNSTDGKIDMSGLPGDEPFVVVAQSDGFNTRRILVPSYYNQSTIYLLPENKTATDTVFSIQDYTGDYPQDSTALLVQRGLNGSWETVAGDYFGATGEFPAQLRDQERHRLVLVNLDTGDRRVVGSYTPLTASQQTVRVTTSGAIDVVGRGLDIAIGPSTRTLTDTANETVSITIEGEDATFQNATLRAVYHNPNRSSTTTLANQTVTEKGEHSLSVNLTDRSGGSLEVVVDYDTDSVSTSDRVHFAIRRAFENENSLLAVLGTVAPRFPAGHVDAFQSIVVLVSAVIAATVTAKQPRVSSELVGGVVILVLAGWAVIGWIGYGIVFVAGTAYVSLGAIRRGL